MEWIETVNPMCHLILNDMLKVTTPTLHLLLEWIRIYCHIGRISIYCINISDKSVDVTEEIIHESTQDQGSDQELKHF